MPRNYTMKKCSDSIPHNILMQTIYIIRDYDRLKQQESDLLYGSPSFDGQPKGNGTTDTTASKAVLLAGISNRIGAVDQAILQMRAKYEGQIKRDDEEPIFHVLDAFEDYGYFYYILFDPKKNTGPSIRTWKYFRQKFCTIIAKKINLF